MVVAYDVNSGELIMLRAGSLIEFSENGRAACGSATKRARVVMASMVGSKITFAFTDELGVPAEMTIGVNEMSEFFDLSIAPTVFDSPTNSGSDPLLIGDVVYVVGKTSFRGNDLEGKRGVIIAIFIGENEEGRGNYFVEMDQDVNGFGCDGLGKKGHCVMINGNNLSKNKRTNNLLFRKYSCVQNPLL
jgi:hypothetical protein